MGSDRPLLIPLDAHDESQDPIVGGKAAKLAAMARAGFTVPRGFCLTTWAYQEFVHDADINMAIRMELGRKSMDDMRWEEMWDAALRIRALFLGRPIGQSLRQALGEGLRRLDCSRPLAIRSSAVGEDSAGRSFAGLHESILGVRDEQPLEDAVRLVWASLWSDAALLYRKELRLDPMHSRMAVLVQEMVEADRSGVAFGRDPRDKRKDCAIIESVPGPCSLLVDGLVDPDRWEIDRQTRSVIAWLPGRREGSPDEEPLLQPGELESILDTLTAVENLFRWSPDMEWTGRGDAFTILQARPITTAVKDELLEAAAGAEEFVAGFDQLNEKFLDIAYDNERLQDHFGPLVRNLVELSRPPNSPEEEEKDTTSAVPVSQLEQRLLQAVGAERHSEARDVMETGRISWKLRDDDNLLVARLESQLLRALDVAAQRLRLCGRLTGQGHPNDSHVEPLVRALRDPSSGPVSIEQDAKPTASGGHDTTSGETPRQLVGQPASPGVATGPVRCIGGRDDLGRFRQGEVLVCDAIQPTMTHLVPLASAVVERRGGMLIHGAIIARELGVPCVNGVRGAAEVLQNGDLVTVDGHLGIVTVGAADFDLEFASE